MLVHYLNVPLNDENKLPLPTLSLVGEHKEWKEEELIEELGPMCEYTVQAAVDHAY